MEENSNTKPAEKKTFVLSAADMISIQAIRSATMQTIGRALRIITEREWEIAEGLGMAATWREMGSWLSAYEMLAVELKAVGAAEKFRSMRTKADQRAFDLEAKEAGDAVDHKTGD